jgi:metal-responsive CopG/Arc/MetJ family transcriptional regulator
MKLRIQVNLPEELVQQIDQLVGPRKRSEFIEQAVLRELRLRALRHLRELSEKFRGLTLGDIYYPSRKELEERHG